MYGEERVNEHAKEWSSLYTETTTGRLYTFVVPKKLVRLTLRGKVTGGINSRSGKLTRFGNRVLAAFESDKNLAKTFAFTVLRTDYTLYVNVPSPADNELPEGHYQRVNEHIVRILRNAFPTTHRA